MDRPKRRYSRRRLRHLLSEWRTSDCSPRWDRRHAPPAIRGSIGPGLRTDAPDLGQIGRTVGASVARGTCKNVVEGYSDIRGGVSAHANRGRDTRTGRRSRTIVDGYPIVFKRPGADDGCLSS